MYLGPHLGPVQRTVDRAKMSHALKFNIGFLAQKMVDITQRKVFGRKRDSGMFPENEDVILRQAPV